MLQRSELEAVEKARELLLETEAFDALGLSEISAKARTVAHALIDMSVQLDGERSARESAKRKLEGALVVIEKLHLAEKDLTHDLRIGGSDG